MRPSKAVVTPDSLESQDGMDSSDLKEPPEQPLEHQPGDHLESQKVWPPDSGDPWSGLSTITTFHSETKWLNHKSQTSIMAPACDLSDSESMIRESCNHHNEVDSEGGNEVESQKLLNSNMQDLSLIEKRARKPSDSSFQVRSDMKPKVNHRFRNKKRKTSHSESLSRGLTSSHSTISIIHSASKHKSGSVSEARGSYVSKDRGESLEGVASATPVQAITRFSPTSLLVESLIDQLCKLMENDSMKQKKLYNTICDKLRQMRLIDDTYTIEEFQFMRSHYQKALYQLLAVAKSTSGATDGRSIMLPLPSSNINVDVHLAPESVMEWSRYRVEYQELQYIAKGGFGEVYKARNKLDGGLYAIKKIFLRYRSVDSFMRSLKEVKMLARLNHPNIVSYKAAWLEPLDSSSRKARVRRSSRTRCLSEEASLSFIASRSRLPLPPATFHNAGDSSDIIFQDTSPESGSKNSKSISPFENSSSNLGHDSRMSHGTHKQRKSRMRLLSELLESSSVVFETDCLNPELSHQESLLDSESDDSDSGSSDSTSDGAVCHFKETRLQDGWAEHYPPPVMLRNFATLYVQMQFCERTLREWLDERNKNLPAHPFSANSVEGGVALMLFRKVVRGVEYIHSQGIVHHDIKPSNIFVNATLKEVQVGDFGLSCCLVDMVEPVGARGDHYGEVGTRMYAAPEQLRGKCTPKSDIYSLGIVLLELLLPFHTEMERSKVIEKLRVGQLPTELTRSWPHAARLMRELLVNSHASRPSSNELLKRVDTLLQQNLEKDVNALLASKDETIRLLQEAISSKDQEIADLKHRLALLESS